MTREQARVNLWDLIEEILPGSERIVDRARLRQASTELAHAAAIEAVEMAKNAVGKALTPIPLGGSITE